VAHYYTLLVTQAFSALGSQISGFAVSIWLYQQTGTPTPLALVGFSFALRRFSPSDWPVHSRTDLTAV